MPVQIMDLETFEQRQAYIDKCILEMRESQAKAARTRALYDEANAILQAFWTQYNAELATLIYRGMFDPNFCKPAAAEPPA
jgi:hypothetical protein